MRLGLARFVAVRFRPLGLRTRRPAIVWLLLLIVVVAGAWLRLSDANWDNGRHLHPDERYVSIVADNIRWPGSLGRYLDVDHSPLSPYNTDPGRAYVYGTLPLFATKLAATAVGRDDYGHLNIVGRRLSAVVDTLSIVLTFLVARLLLEGYGVRLASAGALLAAALYAFTVTAIQHAHFFTVESWVVLFTLLAFYLSVRALPAAAGPPAARFRPIFALIGIALGLAVASKVSGGLVVVPIAVALVGQTVLWARSAGRRDAALRLAAAVLTIVVAAYVAFRSVFPYAFAESNWLNLGVNGDLRSALQAQRDATDGKFLTPPAYQWFLSERLWDPLKNLVLWQLGLPLGIAALMGLGALLWRSLAPIARRSRRRVPNDARSSVKEQIELTIGVMLVAFVAVVFFYVGSRFVHSGRYLVPIVPFLSVAAAYAVVSLPRSPTGLRGAVALALVGTTALYALAFHHVYAQRNTRVAASAWIVDHVPAGATIANEHWDDSLPLVDTQRYHGVVLTVFDADDRTKLGKLYDGLSRADYYVLSSPRAWRTIGRLPDRFPLMVRFYRTLLDGRLGFATAARFTSYPQLFGVRLHDLGAEEAFWVYDHPEVIILRKTRALTLPEFRRRLCRGPAIAACS